MSGPAEGGEEPLVLRRAPLGTRLRFYGRAKALSKALMERLTAWNLELRSPERILENLSLTELEIDLLRRLGLRPEGWIAYASGSGQAADSGRLAALGLARLARWRRRIALTDAGRFLLVLTALDPKIKSARPPGRRKDQPHESLP